MMNQNVHVLRIIITQDKILACSKYNVKNIQLQKFTAH